VAVLALPAAGQVSPDDSPIRRQSLVLTANWLAEATAIQYATPDLDGNLSGGLSRFTDDGMARMIPNQDLVLTRRGQVVAQARTDAAGDYAFSNVSPGIYTVSSSNPKDFLVLPLLVGPRSETPSPLTLVVRPG
jgi:hypothetical protein